jgi:hypothetical protein
MEADDLLCSRNARPEKALVGRALEDRSAPIPREITSKLGRIIFWSLAAALLGERRVPGQRVCLGRLRAGG